MIRLKLLFWTAAGLFLVMGGLPPAYAQPVEVRNPYFSQEGNTIVVTYNLVGEKGETYAVNLRLSTSGGAAFDYEPRAVRGDVGEGVQPGSGKQIRWRVLEDFPNGLQNQNVQFKVTATEEGGNTWLYVLGSAIVASGGGTAVALLTGLIGGTGGGGGNGGNPESPSIPPPDGPPQ
jgi:hypothetical protein